MTERSRLSVCCSGLLCVVVVSGVVDASALSRACASGLLSRRVKVQFLSDRLIGGQSCSGPWKEVLHQKNERLRVGRSQAFGVSSPGWAGAGVVRVVGSQEV
jgi:hypothetical protein